MLYRLSEDVNDKEESLNLITKNNLICGLFFIKSFLVNNSNRLDNLETGNFCPVDYFHARLILLKDLITEILYFDCLIVVGNHRK